MTKKLGSNLNCLTNIRWFDSYPGSYFKLFMGKALIAKKNLA